MFSRRSILCVIALTALGDFVATEPSFAADDEKIAAWKAKFGQGIDATLKEKCLKCHNKEKMEGELDLSKYGDGEQAFAAMDLWERVAKRVRLNEMPPDGAPRLHDNEKSKLLGWLDSRPNQNFCNQLASDETQAWYRGFVMSRRLTKTEYLNSVRDLLGREFSFGDDLPADGSGGGGFDTSGDSLFTSAIHLEAYLSVADRAIEQALTDADEQNMFRQKLLVAEPTAELPARDAARKIIERFLRRAWRRPATAEEVERLLGGVYDATVKVNGSHLSGVRQMFKAALVSPQFLFVVEADTGGGVRRLTAHELAARVALLIWSSIPDDALNALADDGRILNNDILKAQVARMRQDPRARALGENFGLQWLGLSGFLSAVKPDAKQFPEFNPELAADLREEAVALVGGVFRDDRSLLELIDADYTFANKRLAAHYGLSEPAAEWSRVALPDRKRGGVITLGAVLASTSYPLRTSPVLRGKWILEEVLGSKVPPPPPNVPALEAVKEEGKTLSLRERLELHRRDAACSSCHNRMDPLGFGLENFDPLGRWRTEENGVAIDAAGKLPSGETFAGPEALKQTVLKQKHDFVRHFTRKMFGFALGRELNKFDDCSINDAIKKLEANDHRAPLLLEEIVLSYPFQHRYFKKN